MAARRPAIPIIPSMKSCSGREARTSLRAQRSNPWRQRKNGLLRRGARHRACVRATRWLLTTTRDVEGKSGTTNQNPAAGNPAGGQCLCGKVEFEIDTPARWAWHDHSLASRRAHGAAYATYVGSWRKRFRITKGEAGSTRFEDKVAKTARSFCKRCGT